MSVSISGIGGGTKGEVIVGTGVNGNGLTIIPNGFTGKTLGNRLKVTADVIGLISFMFV